MKIAIWVKMVPSCGDVVRDIFEWKMDARGHKENVSVLRRELVSSVSEGTSLPMSIIAGLLPIDFTDGIEEVNDRGDIEIKDVEPQTNGDNKALFENQSVEDLWINFQDPSIRDFEVKIPASFSGVAIADSDEDRISIFFDSILEFEISRLADLGVSRSSFQNLHEVEMTPEATISRFRQANDPDLETWIVAYLVDDSRSLGLAASRCNSVVKAKTRTFDTGAKCGYLADPNAPRWHVAKDRAGECEIVYQYNVGAVTYNSVLGPVIQEECVKYIVENCTVNSSGQRFCLIEDKKINLK